MMTDEEWEIRKKQKINMKYLRGNIPPGEDSTMGLWDAERNAVIQIVQDIADQNNLIPDDIDVIVEGPGGFCGGIYHLKLKEKENGH